ncbi:hypothetical protein PoB_001182900 [Plakobranchus ocellatus]|uniref:Uncharacterized protein n=1 Tax=Plakobranchus ocellatus TaxID=259542 RepID=A0AAV3YTF1_9GAST|nr:hypothetical protein PoB_001182900 [Plakobranchus ocellatus]
MHNIAPARQSLRLLKLKLKSRARTRRKKDICEIDSALLGYYCDTDNYRSMSHLASALLKFKFMHESLKLQYKPGSGDGGGGSSSSSSSSRSSSSSSSSNNSCSSSGSNSSSSIGTKAAAATVVTAKLQ